MEYKEVMINKERDKQRQLFHQRRFVIFHSDLGPRKVVGLIRQINKEIFNSIVRLTRLLNE